MTIDVTYTNLSIKKIIIDTPVKSIPLLVKGSGFKLISTTFSNRIIELNLDRTTKKKGVNHYFLTKKHHSEIQEQLKSGIKLINIQRDTIPLKIGSLHSKTVPLKTDSNINFQLGYDLSTPIKITPNNILISGEKSLIDKINFIKLERINLENLSKNTKINLPINIPENIKTEITSAEISIILDKFTEGEIEVPVFVKNAPKGINIYPKKVKIIYKVGLKNFNKINPNLFRIECDYNRTIVNETSYLTPKLIKSPDSITLVRIVPKKIDFLIHK